MTKPIISPERLKQLRTQSGLSQEGLAIVSGISQKTIARIETGRSSPNSHSVRRLAVALGVGPADLSGQPNPDMTDRLQPGYRRLSAPIRENTSLSFQMVERLYGISALNQVAMAPLFAALLAEGSLAWRRGKLEEAEQAAGRLGEVDYGHLLFRAAAQNAKNSISIEQQSVEGREIFGGTVMKHAAEEGLDPRWIDPFTEYLLHLAKLSGSDLIRIFPEATGAEGLNEHDDWTTGITLSDSSVNYSIDPAELDRLAGDCRWARMALRRGHAKLAGIPEHLLDEDASEERSAWLANRVPQTERQEVEAEDARMRSLIGSIDLTDTGEPKE